jgi:hypothetical protein
MMRSSQLWATAVVALGITAAACSGGSKSPTVASDGSSATTTTAPTTTAAPTGASSSDTELDKALAYSKCMRSHGVPNWPDPVKTPSGDYGFRTNGIDPNSSEFQSAGEACKSLYDWGSSDKPLTPAQQQAWLKWAKCIRSHGVPNFPDPTFSGSEVHISDGGSSSSQLQSAMDACKSQMPSAGGLGG